MDSLGCFKTPQKMLRYSRTCQIVHERLENFKKLNKHLRTNI